MRTVGRFLAATLVGGLIFLIPLVLIVSVVREAIRHVGGVLHPIARLIGADRFASPWVVNLVALGIVILICSAIGMVIVTPPGRRLSRSFERTVLSRVPGYLFIKSLSQGLFGVKSDVHFAPALVHLDDSTMLGFIVERDSEGLVAVFIPSAPTPAVGSLYLVAADRVEPLQVAAMSVISSVSRLGVGTSELLRQARQAPLDRDRPPQRG